MLKEYYQLTKPGIIYANILTAAAGFLFATKTHIDPVLLIAVLLGTSFVIASGCSFNNYIDRNIDAKMSRTQNRALVNGTISPTSALTFASIVGLIGFATLLFFTNTLTVVIGAIAFIDYVVLYGLSKRKSVHGTLVGSISGSASIVAGYVSVTDRLDVNALILFLIMTLWQMPHFYAIAIYRLKDYKRANLPVLPIVNGIGIAKKQIVAYIVAYAVVAVVFVFTGTEGYIYGIVMAVAALYWLYISIEGYSKKNDSVWARKVFLVSLFNMLILSVMLPLGRFLP